MIILVICITGVLVYSAAVALFIAAKMGQIHLEVCVARKGKRVISNIKKGHIYEIPEGVEEPVVTEEFMRDCKRVARKYQKNDKDSKTTEFDVEMILKQIEDYGKYKGILKCDDKRCERYLPVSVAKQIVRARGVGGICGYLEENK